MLIKVISEDIYKIDTEVFGQPRLISAYLVKGKEKNALIDPSFASSYPVTKRGIEDSGLDISNIDYILLTHSHIDHSGGAGKIVEASPETKLIAHPRGTYYLKNSAKIAGGGRMVFGEKLALQFGETKDVPALNVLAAKDGEVIDLGGEVNLKIIYSPGHSADHVSIYEESTGTLFPGDMACLHYPDLNDVFIPAGSPPLYNIKENINSLHKMQELNINKILTPHYGESPERDYQEFLEKSKEAIQDTREKIVKLFKEGIEFHQLIEILRKEVIEKSGKQIDDIPEFLRDVWLPTMIKTGLMGYMAEILEYAQYPRSFSGGFI